MTAAKRQTPNEYVIILKLRPRPRPKLRPHLVNYASEAAAVVNIAVWCGQVVGVVYVATCASKYTNHLAHCSNVTVRFSAGRYEKVHSVVLDASSSMKPQPIFIISCLPL